MLRTVEILIQINLLSNHQQGERATRPETKSRKGTNTHSTHQCTTTTTSTRTSYHHLRVRRQRAGCSTNNQSSKGGRSIGQQKNRPIIIRHFENPSLSHLPPTCLRLTQGQAPPLPGTRKGNRGPVQAISPFSQPPIFPPPRLFGRGAAPRTQPPGPSIDRKSPPTQWETKKKRTSSTCCWTPDQLI